MKNYDRLAVIIGSLVLVALLGCGRQNSTLKIAPNISWTNLLSSTRSNILYGSWVQAENCWADLRNEGRTSSNLEQWVQLQVDVLTITPPDGLKYELRSGAIQEMYWQKEASKRHFGWLKTNIESGFFKEATVLQKARELFDELKANGNTP